MFVAVVTAKNEGTPPERGLAVPYCCLTLFASLGAGSSLIARCLLLAERYSLLGGNCLLLAAS